MAVRYERPVVRTCLPKCEDTGVGYPVKYYRLLYIQYLINHVQKYKAYDDPFWEGTQ